MILVTGGTGMLGAHLVAELVAQNHLVKVLKRSTSKTDILQKVFKYYYPHITNWEDKIIFHEGDVLNKESLMIATHGVQHVYHTAAMVSFHTKDKINMMRVNVEGTENVVSACIQNKVEKLCHVSSIAAFGKSRQHTLIDENSRWESKAYHSNYAWSKYLSEQKVWEKANQLQQFVIINPSVILGIGNWQTGTPKLIQQVANGLKFYTKGATGFVDARDVVRVMIALMQSNVSHQRFIVNAENLTYRTLFNYIADQLNLKRPYIYANQFLSELVWRLEAVKSYLTQQRPFITKEAARAANSTYYFDNSKIKKTLNYTFIPIQKSIEDIARCYKLG